MAGNELFAVNFLVGRGFRSPNLNDLGALGFNDLGYEIPGLKRRPSTVSSEVVMVKTRCRTGRKVDRLTGERMFNYEFGLTVRHRRFYVRTHVFDAELKDPIVRRTLLFPADLVPASLAGIPVSAIAATPSQRGQRVVAVATSADPRAVKAFVNDGQIRYYGVDTVFQYAFLPSVDERELLLPRRTRTRSESFCTAPAASARLSCLASSIRKWKVLG